MTFDRKLQKMLEEIGYQGTDTWESRFPSSDVFGIHESPRLIRKRLDPILSRLFELDFVISDRRELEIRRTIHEMILNASGGCRDRSNLYIEQRAYFGDSGIVTTIEDDGPGFDHKVQLKTRGHEQDTTPDDAVLSGNVVSGNGLRCLLRYPDEFHYNDLGNQVAIRFNLDK